MTGAIGPIVLPLSIVALATGFVAVAALLGLASFALEVAVAGVLVWGGFRLLARLLRGPAHRSQPLEIPAAPPVDRHYQVALRGLDRELGEPAR